MSEGRDELDEFEMSGLDDLDELDSGSDEFDAVTDSLDEAEDHNDLHDEELELDEMEDEISETGSTEGGMQTIHKVIFGLVGIAFVVIAGLGGMKMFGGSGSQDIQPMAANFSGGGKPAAREAQSQPPKGGQGQAIEPETRMPDRSVMSSNPSRERLNDLAASVMNGQEVSQSMDGVINAGNPSVGAGQVQTMNSPRPMRGTDPGNGQDSQTGRYPDMGQMAQVVPSGEVDNRIGELENWRHAVEIRFDHLDTKVEKVHVAVQEHSSLFERQGKVLETITSRLEDVTNRLEGVGATGSMSEAPNVRAKPPRERMKGYNVVAVSEDKDMSIIKTRSGRVIVLFEGEVMHYAGQAFKVTAIKKDGTLVEVGSKYFIDEKREAPDSAEKRAEASEPRRAHDKDGTAKSKGYISGWSVVGFNQETAVIKNEQDRFFKVEKGVMIPSLGRVTEISNGGEISVEGVGIIRADRY